MAGSRDECPSPSLFGYADDLRIADDPRCNKTAAERGPVLCFHLLDEVSPGLRPLGAASRWWLHGSLDSLDRSLRERGAELALFRGRADEVVPRLAEASGAGGVFWSRRYLAAEFDADRRVVAALEGRGIAVETFNGRLLREPGEVRTKTGSPYRVFTPYLRATLAMAAPSEPLPERRRRGTPEGLGRAACARRPRSLAHQARLGRRDARGVAAGRGGRGRAAAGFPRRRPQGPTARGATCRASPAPPACPRTCASARSAPARSGGRRPKPTARRSAPCRRSDLDKLVSEVTWRDFCYELIHDIPDLGREHSPEALR